MVLRGKERNKGGKGGNLKERYFRKKQNKLTKLGRCDRETIELADNSNDSIVRTAGRASK